jgi:hypothetical protein
MDTPEGSDSQRREDMLKYFEPRLSKRLGLLLFACVFFVAFGYAQNASAVVRVSAGVNYHMGGYDLLSEYGDWMRVPPYGVVWCPYVDESWEPFYDGRWIWTSRGWAWDSYEPFGELVYHYGYWYYDFDIGWFWVPGDEWSPARVQWYSHGNYCGWAPLPPPNFYWPDPWDFYDFNIWVIVNINNFCDDHIGYYGIDQPRYRDVFHRDGAVKHAPDIKRVETVTRRQIPVQRITERPMDIRTDKIKITERSTTRRDMRTREAAPENRSRVTTPARNSGVERKAVAEKRNVPSQRQSVQSQRQIAKPPVIRESERKVVAPRANSQPQRQVVASRENAQPQREVAASRRTVQVERKAEAPARSAQSAQSRTTEKTSDRAAVTKAERQ